MNNLSFGKTYSEYINRNKEPKLNSFMFSLMIMTPILNIVTANILPVMSPGHFFAILLIILYFVSIILERDIKINIYVLAFIGFIIIFFLSSLMYLNFAIEVSTVFVNFCFYGILSILIASKELSSELVLRYMIFLSFPAIFDFIISQSSSFELINMSYSYALLPGIIACIIHLIYYRKSSNILIYLAYILNLYLLVIVLINGTRGSYLSIAFLTLILITNQYYKNGRKVYRSIFLIALMILFLVVINIEKIITHLYNFTTNFGLDIRLITKTYEKTIDGSAFNGREYLYQLAFEGIMNKPIFGHGIGSFELLYGTYPHNFILQLLYEGGLILAVPIVVIIFIGIKNILNKQNNNLDLAMLITLTSSISLPRLMVSTNLWETQAFWLFIALIISKGLSIKFLLTFKQKYQIKSNKKLAKSTYNL